MTCAIEHTLFLGASVRNFNVSLGFNQQQSVLNVSLVEDDEVADEETPKVEYRCGFREEKTIADRFILKDVPGEGIGQPAFFKFGGLEFGGLVQNWEQSTDISGKPVFNVQMVDPRELLAGTVVITGGYSGTTNGIANIFNVFAHMEGKGNNCSLTDSGGFGGSMSNDAGMPWNKIKEGLEEIVAPGFSSDFGAPISFRGHTYFLDISELPVVEDYVRVSGNQHSILDLIDFICSNTNHDYYIELIFDSPESGECADVGKYIKVQVVPREIAPLLGRISQFVEQETNAGRNVVSNTSGYELRTEPTTGFLVGGQKIPMYEVYQNTEYDGDPIQEGEEYKYNIWPYWGEDYNGNLVVGTGKGDKHTVNVDISAAPIDLDTILHAGSIFISGGRYYYKLSVREMRFLLISEDAWFAYLESFNPTVLLKLEGVSILDVAKLAGNMSVEDAEKVAIVSHTDIVTSIADKFNKRAQAKLQINGGEKPFLYNTRAMYKFLLDFVSKYYGKYFMISIPEVCAYKETETDIIRYNVEPENSGWVEYDDDVLGLGSTYIQLFRESDGKTKGFAKYLVKKDVVLDPERENEVFVNTENAIIFKNVSENDVVNTLIYTPHESSEDIKFVFKNNVGTANAAFPKVIVQVDGQTTSTGGFTDTYINGLVDLIGRQVAVDKGDPDAINDSNPLFGAVITAARKIVNDTLLKTNLGDFEIGKADLAHIPDAIVLPLKNLVDTYGPWVSTAGPDGPVNFEQNDELVPWNYGSQDNLDTVANILVSGGLSYTQILESGQITFVGTPQVNLGRTLLSQGPVVNGLSVTVGTEGLTTTYYMKTYSPKYGVLNKANADRFRRLSDRNNRIVQKFNNKIKERQGPDVLVGFRKGKEVSKDELMFGIERRRAGVASKSPIGVIYANTDRYFKQDASTWLHNEAQDTANNLARHNVYMSSYSEFIGTLSTDDWSRKAFITLDGLFTPYSLTQTQAGGSTPDNTKISGMTLNTFETGNEFALGSFNAVPPLAADGGEFVRYISARNYSIAAQFSSTGTSWLTSGTNSSTFNNIGLGMRGDGSNTTQIATRETSSSITRSIALRAPLMLSGWGWDINNKPVPNAVEDSFSTEARSNKFLEGFLEKPYAWKTGPVDLRWDARRGMWTCWPGYAWIMLKAFSDPDQEENTGGDAIYLVADDANFFRSEPHYKTTGELVEQADREIIANNISGQLIKKNDHVIAIFDYTTLQYVIPFPSFKALSVVTGVNFGAQTTTTKTVYVAGYK